MSAASTGPKLHKFFVYAPDKEGSASKRFEVRARHLEDIAPLIQSGVVKMGGMMITPKSLETEGQREPLGSCIVYEAENLDAVKKMVESDVYYTAGVWDREKLVVVPFLSATPFP
ncbi:hypothetical protein K435DRAFT_773064 [Dendrothele bispora CBS 962.96]|uniref:YCII-related domain-containing protein n=1 Tax=Dendrothele bispora (strain CBS 962.96) TaxID=1314807 RepID=A0A4S8MVH8_DENBC|nr:hypothetical protein K435DRAFT_773064 [Dendrothele bispora CBS 962.96]